MSIRPVLAGSLVVLLLFVPQASADMGRVYYDTEGAKVSEDSQKAIILHNGREEVLILGTELEASRPTPIIRFIPFPSEPKVSLAPKSVFEKLAGIVAKYKLEYVYAFHSKGGSATPQTAGVEVRLSAKLGAHDITVVRIRSADAFRSWVNNYFRSKKLPHSKQYAKEEAVVADYVARGIDFFVLDYVEAPAAKHFVDPVLYRFKSKTLYYPLKTSNTFGGKGEIELFVVAPVTLCAPGSGDYFDDMSDQAITPQGNAFGKCLNLSVKASTSARLVPEEKDLVALYPDGEAFFGGKPVFLQSIRYTGDYQFADDVMVAVEGVPRALGVPSSEEDVGIFPGAGGLFGDSGKVCQTKPDPGPCKGRFEAYYFDGKSQNCKVFFWGGCQGVVPFESLKECENTCKPSLPPAD